MVMTCVVTGISSGIGREVAQKYIEAGHFVIGISRRVAGLDGLGRHLSADLSVPAEQTRVAKQIETDYKKVDILIHCAGIMKSSAANALDADEVAHSLLLNVGAPISLTSALTKALARAKGSVVFVTSVAVDLNIRGEVLYSTTKAALDKATEGFTADLGRLRIRYFQVRPSICDTPMTQSINSEQRQFMMTKSAHGGMLTTDDVADTIVRTAALGYLESGSVIYCGGVVR